ncbi:hypothetical protein BD769DRAFT_1387674 [Suillus cothurnatus]|nr:hypothetical protein BD769DRAFT_1387674 [Suillus cothurnatus]
MDEIALEERASHHRASNSVIGLCHSHSHLIDPSLHTYDSVLRIAKKLAEGTIHLGKEMSVIAVGLFGDDDIFPVLAAPTCKCKDNGDSTWRAAGHRLCLKTKLSVTSKLYGTLSHMQGLNLATGEGEITLDFDYKHIFKHEYLTIVVLCSFANYWTVRKGMKLVNSHTINSAVLARYLSWLPNQNEASILKLLNPDDPQDVPCAIELMQAIITLSKNEFNTAIMSVGECADIAAIKVLGAILESILLLFIDITLSLHQQKFWLIQTGDDHLEKLFGITWMRGQHNSAMNYSQALDCISTAKDINTDGCDLMRPWGANKYLGISDVEGVELSTNSTSLESLPNTAVSSELLLLVAGPTSIEEEPELDEDVLTLEEALTHDVAFGSPNIDHDPTIPSTSHPDTPALISGPGINPDDYLLVHGKYIHKETICRQVLNKHFIVKSLNRQELIIDMSSQGEKVVEITAPGLLVELVNPKTTCVCMHDDINSNKFFTLNNLGNMWIIEESALYLACDTLWCNACEHSISIKNILHISTPSDPSMFPYALPDGSAGIICSEASKRLAASESGPPSEYPLCGNKTDSMRAHVGIHILRASCGVTSIDNNLKQQVGLHQPCGFCG